ncbi:MAG: hypothetical protein WC869_15845 [Phycisphaerae bacterium]|jgi:hypothetical protein
MAGNQVDIIIRAVEKGVSATFSKLGSGLKTVSANLTKGQMAMASYNKTMDTANRTAGSLRQSVTGLMAVLGGGALFGSAVKSAFSFNQTIEQSKIGIAALVRTFSEADMGESFSQAVEIQKRLQIAGLETTATYEQLLRALQEGVGPALRNGFDPKQIVAFTSAMAQAGAAISLPMDQLGQELRAIMDGTIDRNARIAKALSIDNADIKSWKEAGTLFQELEKRLKAFTSAGDQMAATFGGEWSNFKDAVQMALGANTQKTFAATTAAIHKMRDAIVTIDKGSGTFTFSPRIVAAIDAIDKRLATFLKSFSSDQLAEAMTTVVNVAAAAIDVLVTFSGAVIKVFDALGPLGPVLVQVAGYLTIMATGWKVLSFAVISPLAGILKFSGVLLSLRAGMAAVQLGAVGLTGVFGMLYMAIDYDIKAIVNLISNYREMQQLQKEIAALQVENAAALAAQAKQYGEISAATGVTVTSMQELDAAVAAGKIRWDETVGGWVAGNKKMSAAVAAVTDDMKKRYEDYAKRVLQLQDEIAGKQQSLADKLRAMGRDGMSELSAWRDQKAEADAFYQSAQQALEAARAASAAGNEGLAQQKFAESQAAAEKAQAAYEGMANTVTEGDKEVVSLADGLKTRMDGVKAAGELGVTAMSELKDATAAAARKLDESTGGELGKELPEVAKAFGEITVKAQDLEQQSTIMTDAWRNTWTNMATQGNETIADLESRITELTRDRNITVYVNEVVQKHLGGMVQRLASGGFPRLAGKLPGSDGPDGIRALLAPGEFIMRSAAVRKYGAALFHALNSMRLDVGSLIGSSLSGALGRITVPSMEPVRLFDGGLAGAGMSGTSNTYNLSLTIPGQPDAPQQANARALARMVLGEFEKMHRGRS